MSSINRFTSSTQFNVPSVPPKQPIFPYGQWGLHQPPAADTVHFTGKDPKAHKKALKNIEATIKRYRQKNKLDKLSPFSHNPLSSIIMNTQHIELLEYVLTKASPSAIQHFINKLDQHGTTPLQRAILNKNSKTAQLLLKHGASLSQPDQNGDTPLHWAVSTGRLAKVKFLFELGAQAPINQPDRSGETSLHWAVRLKNSEIVTFLLNQGADPNLPGTAGKTPLYRAVDNNHPMTVKLLLKHGANPNLPDKERKTPLRLAEEKNNCDLTYLLLSYGANPEGQLSEQFRQATERRLNRTSENHSKTLINPEANPKRMGKAIKWFGQFPPKGGALSAFNGWKVATNRVNDSLNANSTILTTPQSTPTEVEEAVQWFKRFPSGGGALSNWNGWQVSFNRVNRFLNNKLVRFFEQEKTERRAEKKQSVILKRVHSIFESGLPSTNSLERVAFQQLAAAFHEQEEQRRHSLEW